MREQLLGSWIRITPEPINLILKFGNHYCTYQDIVGTEINTFNNVPWETVVVNRNHSILLRINNNNLNDVMFNDITIEDNILSFSFNNINYKYKKA